MTNRKIFRNLALFGILASPVSTNAAILTESTTAPTGAAISQTAFDGAGQDSRDRTDASGTPSQTFTVGSAFNLGAITLKGNGNAGGFSASGTYFVLSIRTITGAGASATSGTSTRIRQELSQAITVTPGANSYLTFTLATPLALTAGGIYAFDIYSTDSTNVGIKGTGNSYYRFAVSTTDNLAGGAAYQNGYYIGTGADPDPYKRFSTDPGRFDSIHTEYDRTFYLSAVPEPSSLVILGVAAGGLAFFMRRRQRSLA